MFENGLTKKKIMSNIFESQHDKTNKMSVRPAKTQISMGIRPVWSDSSLSAWRKPGSLASHWAHSEDSDQTGRMPALIWVFAGRTAILFVLSCRGSFLNWNAVLHRSGWCRYKQKCRKPLAEIQPSEKWLSLSCTNLSPPSDPICVYWVQGPPEANQQHCQ